MTGDGKMPRARPVRMRKQEDSLINYACETSLSTSQVRDKVRWAEGARRGGGGEVVPGVSVASVTTTDTSPEGWGRPWRGRGGAIADAVTTDAVTTGVVVADVVPTDVVTSKSHSLRKSPCQYLPSDTTWEGRNITPN